MRQLWIAFTDTSSPFHLLSEDIILFIIRRLLRLNTSPFFSHGAIRRVRRDMNSVSLLDDNAAPLHFELSYDSQSSHPVIVYEPDHVPFATHSRFVVKLGDSRVVSFLNRMHESNESYAKRHSAEIVPSLHRHMGASLVKVKLMRSTKIVHNTTGRAARVSDLQRDLVIRIVVKPTLWLAHKTMGMTMWATHVSIMSSAPLRHLEQWRYGCRLGAND